ncbi:amidohydrolase family protein [Burkholderia humptydooensis]|uniref:Amidohydrolase family protein n=2 Tax=Burkholderia humptydooensis TaxID=430531 RepID=A0A7U4P9R7_9BURK|nr:MULTISPECIES: amidohydrolase family protein [Burkholderia]AJY39874.1 2-pyrone-4,6-dicarboxylic acid hydrolase, putative [Burkholderia sp. 2002721687]ALX45537.1 hypothetical protein AQ610_24065 [Burkholderia humptydooensis]EIP86480.1 hydrolase [Burkholderia humptydooensis MSMB43]QPS47014.1 amidohydrolase family protein [Burkholderia humptydooensis]
MSDQEWNACAHAAAMRHAAGDITAIDAHAHVFETGLPLAGQRRYAPDYDAPLGAYLAQLDAHHVSHGVLVQPSFLGSDCRYLLRALAQQPRRLRGVAVIDAGCEPHVLDALDRAGIVGIRLNLIGMPDPALDGPAWRATLERIAALRWHVELHAQAHRLGRLIAPLLAHRLNIVVDHFGRPDPACGIADAGFRDLLHAAATRRVWVKISGVYRNWPLAPDEADARAREAFDALAAEFGAERLVWGSDWPHTQFERTETFGRACALARRWMRDDAMRRAIFVETPARLFRFGESRGTQRVGSG